jgi:hypothetical protein
MNFCPLFSFCPIWGVFYLNPLFSFLSVRERTKVRAIERLPIYWTAPNTFGVGR